MLTLRWSASGTESTPVVLLPGLQGNGSTLLALARQLVPRWTVRVYDLPDTPLPEATAVLRAAVHDRPHVVAAGIAGLWAGQLTTAHRASLACIGAPLGPQPPVPPGLGLASRLGPVFALAYGWTLRTRLLRDGVPPALAREAARGAGAPHRRLSWLRDSPGCQPDGPVLWMHGADDPQRPSTPTAIEAWLPQATTATVPGRHRPFASHPEAVAQVLERFWQGSLLPDPSPRER